MSEEKWVESEGEKQLEEALSKLRSLKGLKKELTYKAVINYINSMVGGSSE